MLRVATKYGTLEGVQENHSIVFKKVPYAKAPTGELRFRAPQPPEKWEGVYDSRQFPPMAMQIEPSPEGLYGKEFYSNPDFLRPASEDCLYLSIWIPETAEAGDRLPVGFWIHGGAFDHGYASELEFDGQAWNRRNVIFIAVQYRVGCFGFLAHPWLSAETDQHVSGNYGILDQIAALRWVHENIADFGGDPDNVTIFGQSAGAMSVHTLVCSKLTAGLFSHAILQSGAFISADPGTTSLEQAEKNGEEFTSRYGIGSAEELRALSAEQLLQDQLDYQQYVMKTRNTLTYNVTVDHYVLDDTLSRIWKSGKMKSVPYMIGCVKGDLGTSEENTESGRKEVLLEEAEKMAQAAEPYRDPVYVYFFRHPLPGGENPAFHSAELWYVMGTLERCWRPMQKEDFDLSRTMVDAWTCFCKTGKPGGAWRPWTKEDPYLQIF